MAMPLRRADFAEGHFLLHDDAPGESRPSVEPIGRGGVVTRLEAAEDGRLVCDEQSEGLGSPDGFG